MTLDQIENVLTAALNVAADQYQKDAKTCLETMEEDQKTVRDRLMKQFERQEKEVRELLAELEEGGLIRLWSKAADDCSFLRAAAFTAKIRDSIRRTFDVDMLEDEGIIARYVQATATLMGHQDFTPPIND